MKDVHQRFFDAIEHKPVERVPVAGWDNAVPITRIRGIKAEDYYHDPGTKFQTQLTIIDEFTDIHWVPGLHHDFGVATEASAFGASIRWFEDDSPYVEPLLESANEAFSIKLPNMKKDGLLAEALETYRYMWHNVEPRYVEGYRYLDGIVQSMGPVEIAAMLRGYETFFLDLFDAPKAIHALIDICTDAVIEWLRAQEEVNGNAKFVIVNEHFPGHLSPAHIEEFVLPYLKRIFDSFDDNAIKLFHNEGPSDHYLPRIVEWSSDVFHCGDVDLKLAKDTIGDQVCLMGNVKATGTLLHGTPGEVGELCLEKMKTASEGSGYILCTGGAFAPGTPRENLQAMVDAAGEFIPTVR